MNFLKQWIFKVADEIFAIFELIEILGLNIEIKVAQNIYFEKIYSKINLLIEHLETSKSKDKDRQMALMLFGSWQEIKYKYRFLPPAYR